MKNESGFTLLELIITIAIAGILASIAIPAFNTTIDNSKLTSNTNTLVGALSLARSEAVNLGRNVSLSANASAWEVRDVDNNNLLKTFSPNLNNITLTPAALPTITFLPSGHRVFDNSGVQIVKICDRRPVCREITIEISGSVSVK